MSLWEERDNGGYFQSREHFKDANGKIKRGRWLFHISGFDTFGRSDRCTVLKSDKSRDYDVPIDRRDRIFINGKWYGRKHWMH